MTSTPRVRPGRPEDIDGLFALANAGGVGLTNLPPDRAALSRKLEAGAAALTSEAAREGGAAVLLVTEHAGRIVGTSCIFPRVGAEWPFYSYRLTRQTQSSRAAGRVMSQQLLNLVNDFDGEAEVGGLFVDPAARGHAIGGLTARSRYLFMAQHRSWFRTRVLAELRGWQDGGGRSPVWEALGRKFFGMEFPDADRLGALEGNQFIADLGARYPIYVSLLPSDAQAALGRPHDDGVGAYAMLLSEGFRADGYVDIFDGGPTLTADIDALRSIRDSRVDRVAAVRPGGRGGRRTLVCAGEADRFRAVSAEVGETADGLTLTPEAAEALEISEGGSVRYVSGTGRPTAAEPSHAKESCA